MSVLKKISTNHYLLFLIITVAAVVRFWDFSHMQFMHDELSAVIRSQGNSLSEVVYKTAATDVHPVGVPVFVHYWTKWFGTGEMTVKLPFILFGLLSIYYSYKVAEKWFNPTVALFTCAFLATLQFPTMYGQLERPYASGMLFSILMVWCWTLFFFSEKRKLLNAIGFAFFATLCSYNHYFSLLFAALVGATGCLFLNKQNYKIYLLSCLAVVVLFIPHINILLCHLAVGAGVSENWLGKPQSDWLMKFIRYLFHYSMIVYGLVGALVAGSIFLREKAKKPHDKMRVIALAWALLIPFFAYLYSVSKTPVLQFSTFTFGLPFMFMFLFSFYAEIKPWMKIVALTAIVSVNVYTLKVVRKHFQLFYKHPYEEMARISDKAISAFGENRVSVAHFAMPGFIDFYFEKLGKPFKYYRVEEKRNVQGFINYLENEMTDYFVGGNLPVEYVQLVKERYPFVISKDEGFTYTIYCFSKTKPKQVVEEKILFSENQVDHILDEKPGHWQKVSNVSEDPLQPGLFYMRLDSTEYSVGYKGRLKEVVKNKNSILNISAEISVGKEISNPTLVVALEDWGTPLLWRGSEFVEYKTKEVFFNKVYVSWPCSGLELESYPDAVLKVYIWNRDKKPALVKNLKVEAIESNPLIYGLYEPIVTPN